MSIVTLRPDSQLFPAGTTVEVFEEALHNPDSRLGGRPKGALVESAVVSSEGTLRLTQLSGGTAYVGWAIVNGTDSYVRVRAAGGPELAPPPLPALNVADFGALGDGHGDDRAAIQAAVNAALPGQSVFFPATTAFYGVGGPVFLSGGTVLEGAGWLNWWEEGDAFPRASTARMTNPCSIRALPSFAGAAVLVVNDSSVADGSGIAPGARRAGRIERLGIGGERIAALGVVWIGDATDWHCTMVEVADCTGSGVECRSLEVAPEQFHNPQNMAFFRCAAHNNGGNGFSFASAQDSDMLECWAHENAAEGVFLTGSRNCRLVAPRAEWNGDAGILIKGNSHVMVLGPLTDSNEFWGIKVQNEGSTNPVVITAPQLNRDGRNGGSEEVGAKGGGNFAGIGIIGKAGSLVGPVYILGLASSVGTDDTGAGAQHPANGVYAEYATYVYVDGLPWGVTAAVAVGTAATVRYSPGTVLARGTKDAQVLSAPTLSWPNTVALGGATFLYGYGEIAQYGATGAGGVHTQQMQTTAVGGQEQRGRTFFRNDGSGRVQWAVQLPSGANVPLLTENAYDIPATPTKGLLSVGYIGAVRKIAFAYTGNGVATKVMLSHSLGTYNVNVVAQSVSGGHPAVQLPFSFFNAVSTTAVEVGFAEPVPDNTVLYLTVFG